jgi:Mrp family chromosome partitioning ATPase
LFLLPAGSAGGTFASRLYSPNVPRLLDNMLREFDMVVIDAAPLSSLAARPLVRAADAVVMVIGTRSVSPVAAKAAMERLAEDGAVVLGAIMNEFDPEKFAVGQRKALFARVREESYEAI